MLPSFLISSEIMDKTEVVIKEFLPTHISISHKIYKISKESKKSQNIVKQKFFRNELNVWKIQMSDSTYNYAILDNVKGKSMPITFLTIFNSNKQLTNATIIKYREAYGGEVGSKSWLKQFINYSDTSNYKIGNGISGISGATISVNSISKGIHKLSLIIGDIIKDFDEE
jgi:Na+-translocating ferredoxin:NAD+ oxidoreductase RnfG subunit